MAKWYQDFTWAVARKSLVLNMVKESNAICVHHDEEPEGAFILVGNHAHENDPYLVGFYMNCTVNYMANINGVSKFKQKLSHLFAAYGKKKGGSDFKALRQTMDLLKAGDVVGIFPEGDRNWDGKTADFIPGTMNIAKKLGLPIRVARLNGAYITKPRWAETKRKGEVLIDFYTISADEVKNSDIAELDEKVKQLLTHDDIKSEHNKNIKFKGKKLAEGIERVLWYCPVCGADEKITSKDNDFSCTSCDTTWTIDANLNITPETKGILDLRDWFNLQEEAMKNLISSKQDSIITNSKEITISQVVDGEMVNPKKGHLELLIDKVSFVSSSCCGSEDFEIDSMTGYIDNFNKAFEFDYKKKRYRIIFDGGNASKWIFFLNHIKKN